MNVWKLCKMSGFPCSTISTFMSKKTELIKIDTLFHICEGFGITLGEFLLIIHLIRQSKTKRDQHTNTLNIQCANLFLLVLYINLPKLNHNYLHLQFLLLRNLLLQFLICVQISNSVNIWNVHICSSYICFSIK